MTADRELSSALTAVVRQVPGVRDVYASGSVANVIVQAARGLIEADAPADALVLVDNSDPALVLIQADVSVLSDFPVPVTLRAVKAAIAAHLAALAYPKPASVAVKVRLID